MPIITLEGPPILDIDDRRTLVNEISDAAAKAYGIPRDKMIVLIRENRPEQVAIGGELLSDRR